jgi:hypothetical protein
MTTASNGSAYTGLFIPALRGTAIVGSLWNAGALTTGYGLLPSVSQAVPTSRKLAAQQWAAYYNTLSGVVPRNDLITIIACGGLAYLEHRDHSNSLPWKLWVTAAGIMPLGWLWVWILMLKPSNKLLAIGSASESAISEKEPEVTALLQEFTGQLGVRAAFPWVVGGIALWASLTG